MPCWLVAPRDQEAKAPTDFHGYLYVSYVMCVNFVRLVNITCPPRSKFRRRFLSLQLVARAENGY